MRQKRFKAAAELAERAYAADQHETFAQRIFLAAMEGKHDLHLEVDDWLEDRFCENPFTDVEIIAWKGRCEVHERFTGEELETMREADPSLKIIAHPECPPDVIEAADITGSTAGMINYVKDKRPPKVVLVTECSMSSNVAAEVPDVEFVRPCNLCPHMKRITLPKILDALCEMKEEIHIDPAIADRARLAVERMVNLKQ